MLQMCHYVLLNQYFSGTKVPQNCAKEPQKKPKCVPGSVYTHTEPDESLPEQLVQDLIELTAVSEVLQQRKPYGPP